jgi:hypothetical protein
MFSVVGSQGPCFAVDQSGGVPELAERLAALEAQVATLQQVNNNQAIQIGNLKTRLDRAEMQIAGLRNRIVVLEAKTDPIAVAGDDFVISGKNVFIQDGTGATESTSGKGNLTIGYNELRQVGGDMRTGSHNLIVGIRNNYTSSGGLVAGDANTISKRYATVTGGSANVADGYAATVTGGEFNSATGVQAAILGGKFNSASGDNSTVSGGNTNAAQADDSSVSGGLGRTAPFLYNWAAGGLLQDH